MKISSIILTLVLMAPIFVSCSKCYECKKTTNYGSSTRGACFETVKEARRFKKNMENNGYDCRIVPED